MASKSSREYLIRKKLYIPTSCPRPTFSMGVLSYHFRPTVILPELMEWWPRPWVPPQPSSSSAPAVTTYDEGGFYDEGMFYD